MDVVGTIRRLFGRGRSAVTEEAESPEFPENPYVEPELAGFMFKVVYSFVSTAFALVEHDRTVAFVAALKLMTSTSQAALGHIDPVTADRAWSWEIARTAFEGFAHDTDPDAMYAPPSTLTWSLREYVVPMGAEVVAFVDAAFRVDPEASLRVADSLRWHGPRAYKDDDRTGDEFDGNRLARALNAFVILDLCGTYGAQAAPQWLDLVNSPIAGGTEDDEDGDDE